MNQFSSNYFRWSGAIRSASFSTLTLALAACGGKGERLTANISAIGDSGVEVDACNPSATLELGEYGNCLADNSTTCATFEEGASPTGWFRYADKIATTGSFLGTGFPQQMGAEKHCGDGVYAYQMVSQGQNVWGPQFGIDNSFDASSWDGITFWMRQGTDYPELSPIGSSVFVAMRDTNTMVGCNDNSNIDREKCDPYGWPISFDTTWRFFVLPFDDARQRGYGVHEEEFLRTQIKKLTFAFDIGDGANGNWNVWVDDIKMFRFRK